MSKPDVRVRQQLTTNKQRNKQDDSRHTTIWQVDTNNEQVENGMPWMTRGGQAACGEGKQPLNPASSRRRQASNLRGPASSGTARQAAGKKLGKQPEGQASSLKTVSSCVGKQLARRQPGKQPERHRQAAGASG